VAIAAKLSRAHENPSQSPLNATVDVNCSVLHNNGFNVNLSALASPREVKKIIKKLKNGKAPSFDGVPNILLKNMPRRTAV
jgi:cell division septation protein DedD